MECIGIYKDFLLNMYLRMRELLTDFHITTIHFFEKLWLRSGLLFFHLQLRRTKVTITHFFVCNLTKHKLSVYFLILLVIFPFFQNGRVIHTLISKRKTWPVSSKSLLSNGRKDLLDNGDDNSPTKFKDTEKLLQEKVRWKNASSRK